MNLNDFFGPNPTRPDHPHFWALSEIILALDAAVTERGDRSVDDVITEQVATVGDSYSVGYVAVQRAMRIHGVVTAYDLAHKREEVAKTALAYLEGMIVGAQLERRLR